MPSLFLQGTMELLQGCNLDQSLEQNVTGVLNKIREIAGKVCGCVSVYVGPCVRVC